MGSWNAFDPLSNNGNLNDQLNNMMKLYLMNMHKKIMNMNKENMK